VTGYFHGAQEIRIDGGELLLTFFEEALRMRVEHLEVLAAYADHSAFADTALRSLWERALASMDTAIVVRTSASAEAVLRATQFRPRRCDIRISPQLHAKVFVAWRPGAEIALVGSHNLTGAALHTNQEIGILVKPAADITRAIVWRLRAIVAAVVRNSSPYRAARVRPLPDRNPVVAGDPQRGRNAFDKVCLGDSIT
jgi:phosphatidylserine/phosphatidylglycerophosphate/cardiolipin synthase-like enzyme